MVDLLYILNIGDKLYSPICGKCKVIALDSEEIFSEARENERLLAMGEAIVSNARVNLQTNVNEILQRIETLKIKGVTTDSAVEIDELYSKACELCKKHSLDKKIFL